MNISLFVCLIAAGLVATLVVALICKGDVKAGMKMVGFEFTIDAKDRQPEQNH